MHYLLEGSVRKAGNRVRVTVQLIDAEADRHIWADRYDRDLADIFAIQDEVTSSIVATLSRRVEAATRERAASKPTENMAAYECVLAGKLLHHRSTKEDNAAATGACWSAPSSSIPNMPMPMPGSPAPWAKPGSTGTAPIATRPGSRIMAELQTAHALDDNDSDVHRILAAVHLTRDDHDKASYHQERALALNPNDDLIVVQQGELLTWLGRPRKASTGSRRQCASIPITPSASGIISGRAYFVGPSLCRGDRGLQAHPRPGSLAPRVSRRRPWPDGQRGGSARVTSRKCSRASPTSR